MKVAAVVLAAGASRRLGEPKQLVTVGGERLLERAVRAAREARCAPVVVVLGAHAEEIRGDCGLAGALVVVNEDWATGMASSVRTGVKALPPEIEGLVLMTCDQPAVTADHIKKLAAAGEHAATAVGSAYGCNIGVPAYFPAARFRELLSLRGDQGARRLLEAGPAVELADGELDVDTLESLRAARQSFG